MSIIKKFTDSPFLRLICLIDILVGWGEKLVKIAESPNSPFNMFSGTNWFEVGIRLAMAYLIWWLYRSLGEYKEKQRVEIESIRRGYQDDLEKLSAKTIRTIRALQKIAINGHETLLNLWIESRDRVAENNKIVVQSLNKLGDRSVKTRDEHPEITKYKGVVNEKLDEIEDPLYRIIDNWEIGDK